MHNKSVRRVLSWWNGWDTTNMSEPDWMGALEEASHPLVQITPVKTLRNNNYAESAGHEPCCKQPLKVKPEYQGDFLDKLRNNPMVQRLTKKALNTDPTNIYDVYMPSDLLKHQEQPYPNEQTDKYIEFNTPYNMIEDNFGAEPYDRDRGIPEMTEDLRERQFDVSESPEPESEKLFKAKRVAAAFLINAMPCEFSVGINMRTAMKLVQLQESQMYSKSKGGYRPLTISGISVRLTRAEPDMGRWFFSTSSGSQKYVTVFQFLQRRNIADVNKLDVAVSCTCPSFLFYGAQFNAFMNDYLYGKIRPKFIEPRKRDPEKRFLACKHILACIPVVSKYKLRAGIPDKRKPYKFKPEIEKKVPEEKIKVPTELERFEKDNVLQNELKTWEKASKWKQRSYIMKQKDVDLLTYLAHKYPAIATANVAEQLKLLAKEAPSNEVRKDAENALREII